MTERNMFEGYVRAKLEAIGSSVDDLRDEIRHDRETARESRAEQWRAIHNLAVQSHENATTLRVMKTLWAAVVAAASVLAGWIGLRSS